MFRVPVLFLFIASLVTAASNIENTIVNWIGYDRSFPSLVFIKTESLPTSQNRIACHTDNNWNFVLSLETPIEEKMYTALLAAQTSKQRVTLKGSGECSAFPNIERLQTLYVKPIF